MRQDRKVRTADYVCLGERVFIPPTADVSADFQPNGQYGTLVREVLAGVKPWSGRDVAETVGGFSSLPLLVVAREGRSVQWARHASHTARNPGLSPFLKVPAAGWTDAITVHLTLRNGGPVLTRAYAGEVQAPLPWMATAESYDLNGVAGCIRYWKTYAYASPAGICRSTLTNRPPSWAR